MLDPAKVSLEALTAGAPEGAIGVAVEALAQHFGFPLGDQAGKNQGRRRPQVRRHDRRPDQFANPLYDDGGPFLAKIGPHRSENR